MALPEVENFTETCKINKIAKAMGKPGCHYECDPEGDLQCPQIKFFEADEILETTPRMLGLISPSKDEPVYDSYFEENNGGED